MGNKSSKYGTVNLSVEYSKFSHDHLFEQRDNVSVVAFLSKALLTMITSYD